MLGKINSDNLSAYLLACPKPVQAVRFRLIDRSGGSRHDIGLGGAVAVGYGFTPLRAGGADAIPARDHLCGHECLHHAHDVV